MLLPPISHVWISVSSILAGCWDCGRQEEGTPYVARLDTSQRWCIATSEKQAKSSPGNGEQKKKKKKKHKTLIYLYMQHMMNGYKQEYDWLSSVNGVKIRFDGDYILERLCRVVFHIASITHSFHSNLPLPGPRRVLKESCRQHLRRIRITFDVTWSVTCCISHVLVYFQSITPVKHSFWLRLNKYSRDVLRRCRGPRRHKSCTPVWWTMQRWQKPDRADSVPDRGSFGSQGGHSDALDVWAGGRSVRRR